MDNIVQFNPDNHSENHTITFLRDEDGYARVTGYCENLKKDNFLLIQTFARTEKRLFRIDYIRYETGSRQHFFADLTPVGTVDPREQNE